MKTIFFKKILSRFVVENRQNVYMKLVISTSQILMEYIQYYVFQMSGVYHLTLLNKNYS